MGASREEAPICEQDPISLIISFRDLPDPCVEGRCNHKLIDIVFMAMCAVIAGAGSWVNVTDFGKARQAWLKTFLDLPDEIPSHGQWKTDDKSNEITSIPKLLRQLNVAGWHRDRGRDGGANQDRTSHPR